MIELNDVLISPDAPIREALQQIDSHGSGFLLVVNPERELLGVLTDGDIRRGLLGQVDLDDLVEGVMQRKFTALPVETPETEIRSRIGGSISFLPLVDESGRVVDYASLGRSHRFPVAEPVLGGREAEYVAECMQTGWISSQGRFVRRFEELFSEYHSGMEAVAVSNGTVAIHLALVALGIGPGDEVIVPDFTFAATASAVVHAGATPVFVDVDRESWLMNVEAVEAAVTPKTKAILPVHLYGVPCDMQALRALAQQHHLLIIEDCAEALGASLHEKPVGVFGDAGTFSFFGNKTLTTGEGGMVIFRDPEVAARARVLRDHGMSTERKYWHEVIGYNYRLTNLQAAIGVAQMERLPKILAKKSEMDRVYRDALKTVEGVRFPEVVTGGDPVCWLFTFLVDVVMGMSRDDLAERLLRNGIDSRPVFQPLHEMPAFSGFAQGKEFPVTRDLAERGMSLPSSISLDSEEIRHIARTVRRILSVREMTGQDREER